LRWRFALMGGNKGIPTEIASCRYQLLRRPPKTRPNEWGIATCYRYVRFSEPSIVEILDPMSRGLLQVFKQIRHLLLLRLVEILDPMSRGLLLKKFLPNPGKLVLILGRILDPMSRGLLLVGD